jgi:cytoskeletal protein RodZ
MDQIDEPRAQTVGERLRAARIAKELSLEDIAAQTRIPQRHLESLEAGEWAKLPAPTYTIGFARSYAAAIGMERSEIADQLRAEMGGSRTPAAAAEVFEPADPARTMPKWLVLGALLVVLVLVVVLTALNRHSLEGAGTGAADNPVLPVTDDAATGAAGAPAATAPQVAAPAQGPVVISATDQVWLRIHDGPATLKEGVLQAGESFAVPASATAPTLTTGKPEALRIAVGTATAPPIGAPAAMVRNVSLLGPDLMRGPSAAPRAPAAPR